MKQRMMILAALGAAILGPAAMGQERSEDECYLDETKTVSPVEMTACTSGIKGSERTLADSLNNLRGRIPVEYRKQLVKSQRAWAAYRDELCLWEAGGYPGSTGNSAAIIACTADMNRDRAKYLRRDLDERW
jgi:uncharacterized protein YecT (DUF1311 family)